MTIRVRRRSTCKNSVFLLQRCAAFVRHILTIPGMEPETIEAAERLENDLIDAIQKQLFDKSNNCLNSGADCVIYQ